MMYESSIQEGMVSLEGAIVKQLEGKDAWNAWMNEDFIDSAEVPTLTIGDGFRGYCFDGFIFKCNVTIGDRVKHSTFVGAVFHEKLSIVRPRAGSVSFNFQSAIFFEDVSFSKKMSTLNLIGAQFHKMLHFEVDTEITSLLLKKCTLKQGLRINSIKIGQHLDASEMECHGEFDFSRTTVGGNSNFKNSVFSQPVWVYANAFKEMVSFDNCTFHDTAQFLSCSYAQTVHFENSKFDKVPEFFQSNISPESVAGIVVKYSRNAKRYKWIFHRASRFQDAQAYRQLKQMAVTRQDHAAEQRYFAQEM